MMCVCQLTAVFCKIYVSMSCTSCKFCIFTQDLLTQSSSDIEILQHGRIGVRRYCSRSFNEARAEVDKGICLF